jgi:hypothetical protein
VVLEPTRAWSLWNGVSQRLAPTIMQSVFSADNDSVLEEENIERYCVVFKEETIQRW